MSTYGLHVQNILNDFQYCKPDSISLCNLMLAFFSCSRGVLKAASDGSTLANSSCFYCLMALGI